MKTALPISLFPLLATLSLFLAAAASAQPQPASVTQIATPAGPAVRLPVTTIAAPPAPRATYDYTQRLYAPAPGATTLAPQQHAADIVNAFKPIYAKLNNPRIIIYTTRDLLAPPQPTLTTTPAPSGHGVVVTTNTIADRQTTRDIERIAARPYRYAGATIIDQQTATATAAAATAAPEAAPLTRQDLAKLADLAIEILVSSRTVTIPNATNGANTYAIPDIQMTAIRLTDSAILGQATSADITNPLPAAALGSLNVQDVLEATALNLMADITATTK